MSMSVSLSVSTCRSSVGVGGRVAFLGSVRPRLVAGDEADLGRRYREGLKASAGSRSREDGDAAGRLLVEHHLGLAAAIAARCLRHLRGGGGVGPDDLASAAHVGLCRAARAWDPDRPAARTGLPVRFATLAAIVVRQEVGLALASGLSVAAAGSKHANAYAEFCRSWHDLRTGLGRDPTATEHARAMGWGEATRASFARLLDGDAPLEGPGIDACPRPDPEEELADLEEDARGLSAVRAALLGLRPREREVLRLRYLDGGDEPATLEEVGRRLRLTRERIRQIEATALKKVRRHVLGRRALEVAA